MRRAILRGAEASEGPTRSLVAAIWSVRHTHLATRTHNQISPLACGVNARALSSKTSVAFFEAPDEGPSVVVVRHGQDPPDRFIPQGMERPRVIRHDEVPILQVRVGASCRRQALE